MAYIVCTSNLDLVSFLFVPALYSTLKLEIFPFTCNIIVHSHMVLLTVLAINIVYFVSVVYSYYGEI